MLAVVVTLVLLVGSAVGLAPETQQSGGKLSVGVAVPCIPKNVEGGQLARTLQSIASQTLLPNEVVIALSETNQQKGSEVQDSLRGQFPALSNLRVVPDEAKRLAGANRNRAVTVMHTDVVVMMDADDEMVPEALSITESLLRETNGKCMLHTFMWPNEKDGLIPSTDFDWHKATRANAKEVLDAQRQSDGGTLSMEGGGLAWRGKDGRQAQQGHMACLRSVFQEHPYEEDQARGQDSRLVRRLLERFETEPNAFQVLDLPLTVYFPSDHPDNEWTKKHADPSTAAALVPDMSQPGAAQVVADSPGNANNALLPTTNVLATTNVPATTGSPKSGRYSYLTEEMRNTDASAMSAIEELGRGLDALKAQGEDEKAKKAAQGKVSAVPMLVQQSSPEIGIVIMTLTHERNAVLPKVLEHYLAMGNLVKEVHVLWNGPDGAPPPDAVTAMAASEPRLTVAVQEKNSLNNRWLYNGVTAPVSFFVDDDMAVTEQSLACKLAKFREQEALQGSFVRGVCAQCTESKQQAGPQFCYAKCSNGCGFIAEGPWMMRTGALREMYASDEVKPLREYVDNQIGHCDDVLMNLVWWKQRGIVPLSVSYDEASVRDVAKTSGSAISSDTEVRRMQRAECVEFLFGSTHQTDAGFEVITKAPHALAVDSVPAVREYTTNCCSGELNSDRCIAKLTGRYK